MKKIIVMSTLFIGGVTLIAALWRLSQHQEWEWLFAWCMMLIGVLATLVNKS